MNFGVFFYGLLDDLESENIYDSNGKKPDEKYCAHKIELI